MFRSSVRGFSLVELMVAVVIGLIGTMVMFQVFATSESQKRTTGSGGDAQQNGAIGLFTMERELRNSGHGLAQLIALGEPIYGWNTTTGTARPPIIPRPVLITPGNGTNGDIGSDLIEVNYSTFEGMGDAIALDGDWNPNSNSIGITNTAAFREGDLIVVCNPTPSAGPVPPCITAQITDPPAGTTTLFIKPSPDTFIRNGVAKESEFNAPGGNGAALTAAVALDGRTIPASYLISDGVSTDDSRAYNLGPGITSRVYRVQDGRLMYSDNGAWQEFADGIVAVRAQYGLDTAGTGQVNAWVSPRGVVAGRPFANYTPNHAIFDVTNAATTAASWARVIAIRIAIVARSGLKEKTIVESRASIPLWVNPTGNPVAGPSYTIPTGDGQYYRYKVFETIVPFRNMVWTL